MATRLRDLQRRINVGAQGYMGQARRPGHQEWGGGVAILLLRILELDSRIWKCFDSILALGLLPTAPWLHRKAIMIVNWPKGMVNE